MSTEWLQPYLRYRLWTEAEFQSILAGLPPVPPVGEQPKTDLELRDHVERLQDAARHVQDAFRVGDLQSEPSIADERLREQLMPHLDEETRVRAHRAALADGLLGNTYRVRVDAAVRWATSRPGLFPHCPLERDHQAVVETGSPAEPPATNWLENTSSPDDVKRRQRAWRDERLDTYQKRSRLRSRGDLYRHLGLSEAQVEDVVREEGTGFGRHTKAKLLAALGISAEEWDKRR